jgi:hypothetical protein
MSLACSFTGVPGLANWWSLQPDCFIPGRVINFLAVLLLNTLTVIWRTGYACDNIL